MCRQHTQLYMCRQHTYMCRGWWQVPLRMCVCSSICVVSIRQHTSAYVSIRHGSSGGRYHYVCSSMCVVSIRQHTSAYVTAPQACTYRATRQVPLRIIVLILPCVYPQTTVSSHHYIFLQPIICVPSYYDICVLLLLYICPSQRLNSALILTRLIIHP